MLAVAIGLYTNLSKKIRRRLRGLINAKEADKKALMKGPRRNRVAGRTPT